jgi:hypothetical protein
MAKHSPFKYFKTSPDIIRLAVIQITLLRASPQRGAIQSGRHPRFTA